MKGRGRARRWLLGGLAAVLAVGLARVFLGVSVVVGESMLPTFRTGDVLLVNKWAYRSSDPRRGDLVVARSQGEWVIKRVIGLPGERVEVRAGELFIDGVAFPEPYPRHPGYLKLAEGKLFEDRWAILGDNRSLPAALLVDPVIGRAQLLGRVCFAWRWPPALGL